MAVHSLGTNGRRRCSRSWPMTFRTQTRTYDGLTTSILHLYLSHVFRIIRYRLNALARLLGGWGSCWFWLGVNLPYQYMGRSDHSSVLHPLPLLVWYIRKMPTYPSFDPYCSPENAHCDRHR